MAGFEELGREYVEDLLGESVPRATWPDGLRQQLEEFLAAAPELLPPTHPKGPRSLEKAMLSEFARSDPEIGGYGVRGARSDVMLFEDPAPEGVCILRRSCGRSCYCAKAGAVLARQGDDPRALAVRYAPELVAEMRHRFGRHWPAEPPMAERRTVDWIDPHEGLPAVVDRVVFGPSWERPDADPLRDMAAVVEWGRRQC
jgi:hypothetical protein